MDILFCDCLNVNYCENKFLQNNQQPGKIYLNASTFMLFFLLVMSCLAITSKIFFYRLRERKGDALMNLDMAQDKHESLNTFSRIKNAP